MFRSLMFAIGIFLLVFGAETLIVDKWIMSYEVPGSAQQASTNNSQYYNNSPYRTASYNSSRFPNGVTGYGNVNRTGTQNNVNAFTGGGVGRVKPVYQTRDWMPWSLLAGGFMIVLYTFSHSPRRGE